MLKGITLYEPWASLMAIGAKQNETRGQRTNHRGDIAIHAAKIDHGCSDEVAQAAIKAFRARNILPTPCFGCIMAVVELYDVQPSEKFFQAIIYPRSKYEELTAIGRIGLCEEEFNFGNYSPGRFIYMTRNLRRLREPVPCRGYQSIGWTLPDDVEAKVRGQL